MARQQCRPSALPAGLFNAIESETSRCATRGPPVLPREPRRCAMTADSAQPEATTQVSCMADYCPNREREGRRAEGREGKDCRAAARTDPRGSPPWQRDVFARMPPLRRPNFDIIVALSKRHSSRLGQPRGPRDGRPSSRAARRHAPSACSAVHGNSMPCWNSPCACRREGRRSRRRRRWNRPFEAAPGWEPEERRVDVPRQLGSLDARWRFGTH